MKTPSFKRGKVSKRDGVFLGFWADVGLQTGLDLAVTVEDCDRSKFVRIAVRERLARLGINTTEPKTAA